MKDIPKRYSACREPTPRENEIKQLIRRQLLKAAAELKGYKVVLFGSRARGEARERSDFDIGVYGERPLPSKTFYLIEDLLEAIQTLYQIDWVDLDRASPSFRTEALRQAELLYGQ